MTLVPRARAKLTLRVGPRDDADRRARRAGRPPDVARSVGCAGDGDRGHAVQPFAASTSGRAYAAARCGVRRGLGHRTGRDRRRWLDRLRRPSSRRRFPTREILITGVEDPDTRAHGANESLHLADFERACLAEALLLARLSDADMGNEASLPDDRTRSGRLPPGQQSSSRYCGSIRPPGRPLVVPLGPHASTRFGMPLRRGRRRVPGLADVLPGALARGKDHEALLAACPAADPRGPGRK